jgi:hypothetical protein
MALITLDDLAAAMGRASRPFAGDEIGQAQFTIDRIEAFIMAECPGIAFTVTTVVDEKMQADYYGIIEIKKFPVGTITSVKDARTDLTACWDWDDFDTIFDLDPFQTVKVSYTYGFATPPTDLVLVAKSLASLGLLTPAGIRQQTVGAISETYSNNDLSPQDDKILEKYRPYATSLRLGPQTGRHLRNLPTL